MDNTVLEMSKELSNILKQIQGVTGVSETVALAYVVVTQDEQSKMNVNKVATELMKQASNHNLDLEIVAATQADLDDAKKKIEKLNAKKSKSKKVS